MGEHSVSYVPSSFSSEMTLDELRDAMLDEAVLKKAIETTVLECRKTEPDEKDKKIDKKRKKKAEKEGEEKVVKTYSLSSAGAVDPSLTSTVSSSATTWATPYYYGSGDTSGLGITKSIDTIGIRPDLETITIGPADYHSYSEPVYAESFLPHLVRAQDEGRRRNIEMDTIVIDRGVAVSQGLDHVDMILGLKVKYAKEGSLPMDSAFIIMKDDKKKEPEKKEETEKKKHKVSLRSASFKVADSIASISEDVHPHQLYSLYDPTTNAFYVEMVNKDGELERVKLPDLTAEETRKLAEKMENEERERIKELWK